MFNKAAQMLAGFIPQNKEDVLRLLKLCWVWFGGVNVWLGNILGIDIQNIINKFSAFVVKYFSLAFNFIIELLQRLSERV